MSLTLLTGFAGLCLLLAITPGPDTFLILRYSLSGARYGVAAAFGSGIGSLFWAAMVALGLGAVLERSAAAFFTVKVVGGLYLLYLGVSGFIGFIRSNDASGTAPMASGSAPVRDGPPPPPSTRAALNSGLFSCMLNPKVGLFFLAVVPQFLPADAVGFGSIMVLGVIDGVVAVAWLVLLAKAAAHAVVWLQRPKITRTMGWISSGILALLGVGTLVTAGM
ncbi:LysE family translocator [Streptomyces sp. NBC_00335]|uniref:LysE family translocator n=1 Tax=unclassified Streptomyces TaxID=2593676 RepID=UPI00224F7522|nr:MULTISPECIES: LysE family translocator [unclassified Streptomyces]MCX5407662.1 LysE family translocator [Streptomyces sp. NBC_00086]